MTEDGIFEFEFGPNIIRFDTSYLTIIASGAFIQIQDKLDKEIKKIGFGDNTKNIDEVASEKFKNYGFPDEFIGRFSSIVKLNDLTKEDLKTILLTSKMNSLQANIEMLKSLNTKVILSDELMDKIVEKAYKQKTGARALNQIINELFDNAIFDVLSDAGTYELILEFDNNALEDNKQYKITKK